DAQTREGLKLEKEIGKRAQYCMSTAPNEDLLRAALENRATAVRRLLRTGADPRFRDTLPLSVAAKCVAALTLTIRVTACHLLCFGDLSVCSSTAGSAT